jgi:hypothetical protein
MKGTLERYTLLVCLIVLLAFSNMFLAKFINAVLGDVSEMRMYPEFVLMFSIAEAIGLTLGCVSMSIMRRMPGTWKLVGTRWEIQKSTIIGAVAVILSYGSYAGLNASEGDPFVRIFRSTQYIQNADEQIQERIRERLQKYVPEETSPLIDEKKQKS